VKKILETKKELEGPQQTKITDNEWKIAETIYTLF
jgi:hypothetical protein